MFLGSDFSSRTIVIFKIDCLQNQIHAKFYLLQKEWKSDSIFSLIVHSDLQFKKGTLASTLISLLKHRHFEMVWEEKINN